MPGPQISGQINVKEGTGADVQEGVDALANREGNHTPGTTEPAEGSQPFSILPEAQQALVTDSPATHPVYETVPERAELTQNSEQVSQMLDNFLRQKSGANGLIKLETMIAREVSRGVVEPLLVDGISEVELHMLVLIFQQKLQGVRIQWLSKGNGKYQLLFLPEGSETTATGFSAYELQPASAEAQAAEGFAAGIAQKYQAERKSPDSLKKSLLRSAFQLGSSLAIGAIPGVGSALNTYQNLRSKMRDYGAYSGLGLQDSSFDWQDGAIKFRSPENILTIRCAHVESEGEVVTASVYWERQLALAKSGLSYDVQIVDLLRRMEQGGVDIGRLDQDNFATGIFLLLADEFWYKQLTSKIAGVPAYGELFTLPENGKPKVDLTKLYQLLKLVAASEDKTGWISALGPKFAEDLASIKFPSDDQAVAQSLQREHSRAEKISRALLRGKSLHTRTAIDATVAGARTGAILGGDVGLDALFGIADSIRRVRLRIEDRVAESRINSGAVDESELAEIRSEEKRRALTWYAVGFCTYPLAAIFAGNAQAGSIINEDASFVRTIKSFSAKWLERGVVATVAGLVGLNHEMRQGKTFSDSIRQATQNMIYTVSGGSLMAAMENTLRVFTGGRIQDVIAEMAVMQHRMEAAGGGEAILEQIGVSDNSQETAAAQTNEKTAETMFRQTSRVAASDAITQNKIESELKTDLATARSTGDVSAARAVAVGGAEPPAPSTIAKPTKAEIPEQISHRQEGEDLSAKTYRERGNIEVDDAQILDVGRSSSAVRITDTSNIAGLPNDVHYILPGAEGGVGAYNIPGGNYREIELAFNNRSGSAVIDGFVVTKTDGTKMFVDIADVSVSGMSQTQTNVTINLEGKTYYAQFVRDGDTMRLAAITQHAVAGGDQASWRAAGVLQQTNSLETLQEAMRLQTASVATAPVPTTSQITQPTISGNSIDSENIKQVQNAESLPVVFNDGTESGTQNRRLVGYDIDGTRYFEDWHHNQAGELRNFQYNGQNVTAYMLYQDRDSDGNYDLVGFRIVKPDGTQEIVASGYDIDYASNGRVANVKLGDQEVWHNNEILPVSSGGPSVSGETLTGGGEDQLPLSSPENVPEVWPASIDIDTQLRSLGGTIIRGTDGNYTLNGREVTLVDMLPWSGSIRSELSDIRVQRNAEEAIHGFMVPWDGLNYYINSEGRVIAVEDVSTQVTYWHVGDRFVAPSVDGGNVSALSEEEVFHQTSVNDLKDLLESASESRPTGSSFETYPVAPPFPAHPLEVVNERVLSEINATQIGENANTVHLGFNDFPRIEGAGGVVPTNIEQALMAHPNAVLDIEQVGTLRAGNNNQLIFTPNGREGMENFFAVMNSSGQGGLLPVVVVSSSTTTDPIDIFAAAQNHSNVEFIYQDTNYGELFRLRSGGTEVLIPNAVDGDPWLMLDGNNIRTSEEIVNAAGLTRFSDLFHAHESKTLSIIFPIAHDDYAIQLVKLEHGRNLGVYVTNGQDVLELHHISISDEVHCWVSRMPSGEFMYEDYSGFAPLFRSVDAVYIIEVKDTPPITDEQIQLFTQQTRFDSEHYNLYITRNGVAERYISGVEPPATPILLTATATDTATPTPSNTPTSTPMAVPTETATLVPSPTSEPSKTSTPLPTNTSTDVPTRVPPTSTPVPTETPTVTPGATAVSISAEDQLLSYISTVGKSPEAWDDQVLIQQNERQLVLDMLSSPHPGNLLFDALSQAQQVTLKMGEVVVWVSNGQVNVRGPIEDIPNMDESVVVTSTQDLGTAIPTEEPIFTPTNEPIDTFTPTSTPSATNPPTATPSPVPSLTETPTDTPTATSTATQTPTDIPSPTPTITPTSTLTATDTATATQTETQTPVATQTQSPTVPPTSTLTPTDEPTIVPTDTPTATLTPSSTPTEAVTNTQTPSPTFTPEPTNEPSPTSTPGPELGGYRDEGNALRTEPTLQPPIQRQNAFSDDLPMTGDERSGGSMTPQNLGAAGIGETGGMREGTNEGTNEGLGPLTAPVINTPPVDTSGLIDEAHGAVAGIGDSLRVESDENSAEQAMSTNPGESNVGEEYTESELGDKGHEIPDRLVSIGDTGGSPTGSDSDAIKLAYPPAGAGLDAGLSITTPSGELLEEGETGLGGSQSLVAAHPQVDSIHSEDIGEMIRDDNIQSSPPLKVSAGVGAVQETSPNTHPEARTNLGTTTGGALSTLISQGQTNQEFVHLNENTNMIIDGLRGTPYSFYGVNNCAGYIGRILERLGVETDVSSANLRYEYHEGDPFPAASTVAQVRWWEGFDSSHRFTSEIGLDEFLTKFDVDNRQGLDHLGLMPGSIIYVQTATNTNGYNAYYHVFVYLGNNEFTDFAAGMNDGPMRGRTLDDILSPIYGAEREDVQVLGTDGEVLKVFIVNTYLSGLLSPDPITKS